MSVAQDCGFAGGVQPVRVNERMPRGLDDLDVFHPRCAQSIGHESSCAAYVSRVLGKRADARYPNEVF